MGIPRLTNRCLPYSIDTIIGCSDPDCGLHKARSSLVIDGPGLAYHLYYRLLSNKPITLNAIDAQPSYEEVGRAAVLYLRELQNHNISV